MNTNQHSKILITGATGNVGRFVTEGLLAQGVSFRAADRGADQIKKLWPERVEGVFLDFTKPSTYQEALEGIETVFLMRPPAISNIKKHIEPFIIKAVEMGVKHIVFLSLMGVEKNTVVPHHKVEKAVKASGLNYTFVRPSFFMQNLDTTHREEISQGRLVVPAGGGKTSFIDVRDIADVVVLCLLDTELHCNKAYEISGEEALDYYQVAALLSTELGFAVHYESPSLWTFARYQRHKGTPWAFVLVMAALYTVARLGMAANITHELSTLLGRAPRTIADYVHDYRQAWLLPGEK